jgi:hypothetical protein
VSHSSRPPFSWISPVAFWRSRSQLFSRYFGDPTKDERNRWLDTQQEAGELPADMIIKDHGDIEEASSLIVEDTGEGDAQYAVVKPLLARGQDTHFMVTCSDVIYPAGDIGDYETKFYEPEERCQHPIYALPGNHDWYDGLNSLMFHPCGGDAPMHTISERKALAWNERLRISVREGGHKIFVSERARHLALLIFSVPGRARDPFHHYFSEVFDWNEPPLLKNVPWIDAAASQLTIRCYQATGCLEHERDPAVGNHGKIKLEPWCSEQPDTQ